MARPCTLPPSGPPAALATALAERVPALEGGRLRLRAPTLHDYPDYARIMAADTGHMGGPFTPRQVWQDFCNYVAGWLLHGLRLWTVERADGVTLGFVNLAMEWEDEEPELGWMFLPEYRGQGYATEAAALARDRGVEILPTFVSYVDPENAASRGVAARLGAVRDRAAEAAIGENVHVWRHGGHA